MDYKSYEFVSKNPSTPEYAVHILNQHVRQWYADPRRLPSDRYEYEQLLPHGDTVTKTTSVYRKNFGKDWEWNDDDYLVTSTLWPAGKAIFYDSDEEVWSVLTPSIFLPGAWVADNGLEIMDADTFPEELLSPPDPVAVTAEAFQALIRAQVLQAHLHLKINEMIDRAKVAARLP